MATIVYQRWEPDPTAFGPRRARAGGRYGAFVPDPLVPRPVAVDARVAADVADAEHALAILEFLRRADTGP